MNWDAVSATADVIGLIIIVVSLIYISLQVKQANDHATASSEIAFIEKARGTQPSIAELAPWWDES